MIYGLTFNDVHVSTFNAYIKSINRCLSPTLRKKQLIIPGRHGTLDFEGETYENRLIEVEINIIASSLFELRVRARQIAAWLRGKSKLVFDDEPDKYYIAKVYESVNPEDIATTGKLNIIFECEPMAYYIVPTSEEIYLDSNVILDSDITLDNRTNYIYSVTEDISISVDNIGSFEARPKIEISGTFSTFIITINGKNLTINEEINNETIIIDNENYTVKKNGVNKLGVVTGDLDTFLELSSGTNTVNISGTGLNCSVLFDFRALYL